MYISYLGCTLDTAMLLCIVHDQQVAYTYLILSTVTSISIQITSVITTSKQVINLDNIIWCQRLNIGFMQELSSWPTRNVHIGKFTFLINGT